MGMQEFQQPRHSTSNGDHITLIQVVAQLEVTIDGVGETALTHLAHILGEIIGDQTIAIGEKLRPHLGDVPAGNIGMEAIEEGRIDHRFRERRQQMAGLDQGLDTLVDVADKHHGGFCLDGITTTGEGSRSHVILHDLYAVFILEGDPRHLIKSHHIPHAHQTNLARTHVVKQVSYRCLPTRDQQGVG